MRTTHFQPCDVMHCLLFSIIWRTRNLTNDNLGTLCGDTADIVSIIATCEIQQPSMLITSTIGQVGQKITSTIIVLLGD